MDERFLFGLILDTTRVVIKRHEISYHIIGFKALNMKTYSVEDLSLQDIAELSSPFSFDKKSRYVITSAKNSELDICSIVTDGDEQVIEYAPVPTYSKDGSLFHVLHEKALYFKVSRSILIKLDVTDQTVSFITGINGRSMADFIESSQYMLFGSVLSQTGEFSEEQKYRLFTRAFENVYSLGDTVYVDKTVDRLVLPNETKNLEVHLGKIKELVCNESLESIILLGKMPDKLYISKKASKKLVCSILYSAVDSELNDYGKNSLKRKLLSMLSTGRYDEIIYLARGKEHKAIIDASLRNTEVVVY
jgi:hypothetical protein